MKHFSNLDGEMIDGVVAEYAIPSASDTIDTNYFDHDNFYPADGGNSSSEDAWLSEVDPFGKFDELASWRKRSSSAIIRQRKYPHIKQKIEESGIDPYATFDNLPSWNSQDEEYSPFLRKAYQAIFGTPEERQERRETRRERRARRFDTRMDAREARTESRRAQSETQRALAEDVRRGGDDSMLRNLTTPTATADQDKGLSTGAKIAIGVGVVALVGGVAYFVIKARKKK